MAFKMRGHELPGIKQRKSSKPSDGKASSSPYQKNGEYGKRHDKLRAKGHQARAAADEAFDAGKKRKTDRLDRRAERHLGKARDIRVKSAVKFNEGLKSAAAEGKLDNNPKFKAAVENSPAKSRKADPASVTRRKNEGDAKGARLERRRGKAAAKGNTSKAKRLARKLKAHDATDNRGKQKARTTEVKKGGRIQF